jgi:leucyl aminopeptidase
MSNKRKSYEIKFTLASQVPDDVDIALIELSTNAKRDKIHTSSSGQENMIISLGSSGQIMSARKGRLVARRIIATARKNGIRRLAIDTSIFGDKLMLRLEDVLVEFAMANYEHIIHKTPPKDGVDFVEEIFLYAKEKTIGVGTVAQTIARAKHIGASVNLARDLSNAPTNHLTPEIFCNEATRLVADLPIKITILNQHEMEELGMGCVLAVGKGSAHKPRFLVMEYMAGETEKPIVLIGKGVVFDNGGVDLKPSDSLTDMHMDKSGAAAVVSALIAAAHLGIQKNIVALAPLVENSVSGESYRRSDVITAMDGKTIEITNTDAEGRLILADALTYAKRYNPRIVIDVATLTGAAHVALLGFSALFTRADAEGDLLSEQITKLGDDSGDYLWRLPLLDEYDEQIKADHADLRNTGKVRYGGASTAAAFLKQFADGYRWAHIDIAPMMTSADGDFLAKGASGTPVRLLVRLLEEY